MMNSRAAMEARARSASASKEADPAPAGSGATPSMMPTITANLPVDKQKLVFEHMEAMRREDEDFEREMRARDSKYLLRFRE